MTLEQRPRQQLADLLRDGNAHIPFAEAVADFPIDRINDRAPNVPYSYWHLIEHLRITQRDILDYLADPDYTDPVWPRDYWPAPDAMTDAEGWNASIAGFETDLSQLVVLVQDPATDLTAAVPSNPDHTVLREILIVADHNAYHIGELAILRQVDELWGSGHE